MRRAIILFGVILGLTSAIMADSVAYFELSNCATSIVTQASTNAIAILAELTDVVIYRTGVSGPTNVFILATVSNASRSARTVLTVTNYANANWTPLVYASTPDGLGTNGEAYAFPVLNQRLSVTTTAGSATGVNAQVFVTYRNL